MRPGRVAAFVITVSLALLFAGAVWLRASNLQAFPRHWADESYYGILAQGIIQGRPIATRTSSGNLPDPFFVATLIPLHLAFGPSLTVLRAAGVISGLAAVGLLWHLGRKPLGPATSLAAAVLLATAPAAIAFSRVGCEYSQTPLVGALAACLALRARGPALLLTLLAGLLVHPTNLFLIPFWLPVYLVQAVRARAGDRGAQVRAVAVAILATVAVAGPSAFLLRSNANVARFAGLSRDPFRFLEGFGRLLIWSLTPTSESNTQARMVVVAILVLVMLGGARLVLARRWDRLVLVASWAAGLAAFDVAAGADALTTNDRYGAVLLVPTAIALAVLLGALVPEASVATSCAWNRLRSAPVVAVGWALLLTAHANYLHPYCRFYGRELLWQLRGRDAYHEAFRLILDDSRANGSAPGMPGCRIWTQEYFLNGLILEYLAEGRPDVEVRSLLDLRTGYGARLHEPGVFDRERESLRRALEAGDYVVAEDGTPPDWGGDLIQSSVAHLPADRIQRWSLPMLAGPRVTVYRLRQPEVARSSDPDRAIR